LLAIIHSIHPCNITFIAPWFLLYPYTLPFYWFGSHLPFTTPLQKNRYSITVSLIPYQFTFQPWTHGQQGPVKYFYMHISIRHMASHSRCILYCWYTFHGNHWWRYAYKVCKLPSA